MRLASDDFRGIRAKTFGFGSDGKGASGGKEACTSLAPCDELAGDIGRDVSVARPRQSKSATLQSALSRISSRKMVSPSLGMGSSFCQNLKPLRPFLGLFPLSLGAEDSDGEGIGTLKGAAGEPFALPESPVAELPLLFDPQLLRLRPPNLLDLADDGGASKYSDDALKLTCFGDNTGGVFA